MNEFGSQVVLRSVSAPNTACTRRVGVCTFFKPVFGFKFLPFHTGSPITHQTTTSYPFFPGQYTGPRPRFPHPFPASAPLPKYRRTPHRSARSPRPLCVASLPVGYWNDARGRDMYHDFNSFGSNQEVRLAFVDTKCTVRRPATDLTHTYNQAIR